MRKAQLGQNLEVTSHEQRHCLDWAKSLGDLKHGKTCSWTASHSFINSLSFRYTNEKSIDEWLEKMDAFFIAGGKSRQYTSLCSHWKRSWGQGIKNLLNFTTFVRDKFAGMLNWFDPPASDPCIFRMTFQTNLKWNFAVSLFLRTRTGESWALRERISSRHACG